MAICVWVVQKMKVASGAKRNLQRPSVGQLDKRREGISNCVRHQDCEGAFGTAIRMEVETGRPRGRERRRRQVEGERETESGQAEGRGRK